MNRRNWLAAAVTGAASGALWAQAPAWSLQAQQRLLSGPEAGAPGRLADIARSIGAGEAALAAGEVAAAETAFDAAASMVHSADVEMGLVRTYMQAGDYRRALTFASHAAGAHRQVASATALYAWLLRIGGQGLAAQRFVDDALAVAPTDAALLQVRELLGDTRPLPSGAFLAAPVRAAPYATGDDVPAPTKVLCTAVLVDGGRQALAPAAALDGVQRVWLRNGMGHTRLGLRVSAGDEAGVCRLRLSGPLPDAPWLSLPERQPFAGSPAFTIEFVPSPMAAPAWPLLQQGFFGRHALADGSRSLGIDASTGPRGGPVFDALGRLAGIAISRDGFGDTLVPATALEGVEPGAPGSFARTSVDQIYETGLRIALQVLLSS